MQTRTFSNGPLEDFDDDAVTVVVDREFSRVGARRTVGWGSGAHALVAPDSDADEPSPPTQRSIEATPSGPSRPYAQTVMGSGVHNAASEESKTRALAGFVDEPSPVPWTREPSSPSFPVLAGAPLPPILAAARSRAESSHVSPAPRRAVIAREPAPAPRAALVPHGLGTPPAMAITLPAAVRTRVERELMGPASVFQGKNRTSALLAAASLVITLILGVVLLLPRSGQLRIAPTLERGTVSRAEVFVDGAKRCDVVPCLVQDLSPGQHAVELRAPGYRAEPRVENVDAGKERLALVPVRAEIRPAAVRASSDLAGIRAFVDGVDRGLLPLQLADLAPGEHRVRFEAPGSVPVEQTVTLGSGEVRDFGVVHLAHDTK